MNTNRFAATNITIGQKRTNRYREFNSFDTKLLGQDESLTERFIILSRNTNLKI